MPELKIIKILSSDKSTLYIRTQHELFLCLFSIYLVVKSVKGVELRQLLDLAFYPHIKLVVAKYPPDVGHV